MKYFTECYISNFFNGRKNAQLEEFIYDIDILL